MTTGETQAPPQALPKAETPTPQPSVTICPYCGSRTRALDACESCGGRFDPLSRQATQNAMGPWFIRDDAQPFRPGCSYETMVRLVDRGSIKPDTPVRGPTSRQFWTLARWCPGLAHRLGVCHNCRTRVDPTSTVCQDCGVSFTVQDDRQVLGLGEVRFVPGTPGTPQREPASTNPAPSPAPNPVGPSQTPQPTPVAQSVPEPTPAPSEPAPNGQSADDQVRVLRLQNQLRRSRRWMTVWSILFAIAALAIGGFFLAGRLDLQNGPLAGLFGTPEESQDRAADAGEAPNNPGQEQAASHLDESIAERQSVSDEAAGPEPEPQPKSEPEFAPDPTPETDAPPASPDGSSALSDQRRDMLRKLRRLR